ncbi:hypothetical protein ACFWN7_07785 [Agromyces sp. NPDC058484]|uniref:hypothetical protein n=1 Tax=Agromyces sp. NPDC058484 TaxID=3346524 RepID=UPI00365D5881
MAALIGVFMNIAPDAATPDDERDAAQRNYEEAEAFVAKHGFSSGGPVPPREFPEWEWAKHPLLARAVVEDWLAGDVIRPIGLSRLQLKAVEALKLVDRGDHRAIRVPPRFNADPFMSDTVRSSEDLIRGLLPDITRYYQGQHPTGELGDDDIFFIAVTETGGRRRFFRTNDGARLVEIAAGEITTWLEFGRGSHPLTEREVVELEGSFLVQPIARRNPIDPQWTALLPHAANRAVWEWLAAYRDRGAVE